MQTRKPRKGDVVELRLEGLGEKGEALGREGDFRFRVRGGVPGARVLVQVFRRRRNDVDARVTQVLERGPEEVDPRCSHFGTCGGCARQDLAYGAQLVELERLLEQQIAALIGPQTRVDAVLGMQDPWHYRNKMDFTFGNRRWVHVQEPEDAERDFALGLHVPGRFDKVLDIDRCHIAFSEASAIVASARRVARELGLSAWDVREHRGLLRHLVLRKGFWTSEILAYLVTAPASGDRETDGIERWSARMLREHPEITTLVHGVNDGVATVATAQESRVLHGPGWIHEELLGLRFVISPESFFQTNTLQAEELARIVREEGTLAGGASAGRATIYDLYCGGGALSLVLASTAGSAAPRAIWGFELVESAVRDARANAQANGIEQARFVAGDLAETLSPAARASMGLEPPDVCIVDPPRAGMHASVVAALAELAPARIVHVSCNPRSAVRDLELLCAQGYSLARVRPVDLFPHTPHLECVFTLERTREA